MSECKTCKEIINNYIKDILKENDIKVGVNKLFNHCFMIDGYKDYDEFKKDLDDNGCTDEVVEYYKYKENYINDDYNRFFGNNFKGDGDHVQVCLAIYRLLWGETIKMECYHKEDKKIDYLFYNNGKKFIKFGGDTINTRDSVFPKNNKYLKEEYYNNDEKLIEDIKQFRMDYIKLGNFIPTPKGLNSERGLNNYLKDQFDLYLKEIYDFYNREGSIENFIYKKINDAYEEVKKNNNIRLEEKLTKFSAKSKWYKVMYDNKDYFNIFDNFEDFIKKNYLECYTKNGEEKEVMYLFEGREENQIIPKGHNQCEAYLKNVKEKMKERGKIMKDTLIEML